LLVRSFYHSLFNNSHPGCSQPFTLLEKDLFPLPTQRKYFLSRIVKWACKFLSFYYSNLQY
jgi:hypothetical protein